MKYWKILVLTLALYSVTGCGSSPSDPPAQSQPETRAALDTAPEATSLLGQPLVRYDFPQEERQKLEANLEQALQAYNQDPENVENILWLGRRQAYLWHYREAVATFSKGLEKHPDNAALLRHRGHRYITLREFDKAIEDLHRAGMLIRDQEDEIEPDGQPNPQNVPRSTLHQNIWYHLGLAHYLKGSFPEAVQAYLHGLEVSDNDDMLVAFSDWLYMSYRRLGEDAKAAELLTRIQPEMDILENSSYHRRLLMYKGEIEPEALLQVDNASDLEIATQGYGVGNWYLYNGDKTRAIEVFRRVLEGKYWAAFGYIASEADLARLSG